MAGFSGVRALVDAELDGKSRFSTWRKSPTQATTIGIWFDLSMSPGNPAPQYYIGTPLTATPMARSTDGGLYHGHNVSPATKYLRMNMSLATVVTALPMAMILQDYLMFYSFIDESLDAEAQLMDNTQTLPRYTTGAGVQIMPVVVAGHATGGQTFVCSYTNQDGVAGRTTQAARLGTQFVNGTILTSQRAGVNVNGPYLTLQGTDTGVRSIESVTMTGADVGLFALVLVKPLLTTQIRGIDAVVEVDQALVQGLTITEIKDDAYLNFICLPAGSLAATALHGYIKTVWT